MEHGFKQHDEATQIFAIYSFGSNGTGQLGIDGQQDVAIPQSCKFTSIHHTECQRPVRVTAGGNHTLILLENGEICSAGINVDGRLGVPNTVGPLSRFKRIPSQPGEKRYKLCGALWDASVFLTEDNQVYLCGSGSKGELGLGQAILRLIEPQALPTFCPIGTVIQDIACGVDHTVVVLSQGDVYGWGNGRKGQLGEPSEFVWRPRKIEGLDLKAFRAVCGRDFTYIVGDPGEGRHAVLGSDKWKVKTNAPRTVAGWKDIGASWGSLFVLKSSGEIISWGRNDHGQLAPPSLPKVDKIAVGSEHVLALTPCGQLLAWGWGEHGNCGPATDDDGDVKPGWNEILSSQMDKRAKIVGIGAGCATSWLWTTIP